MKNSTQLQNEYLEFTHTYEKGAQNIPNYDLWLTNFRPFEFTPHTPEKDKHKTKVEFLINETDPNFASDVFAYFPNEFYNTDGKTCTCYAHIGQHSACAPEYVKESRKATPGEFYALKKELENLGYNLHIVGNIFSMVIDKVSCKFGAPMGRFSNDETAKPKNQIIFDRKVKLAEGYDKGGAYWGAPDNLRVEYTRHLNYIRFYRTSK